MDIITLVGPRGVGKSTTGKKIANSLGWEFIDLDQYMTKILEEDGGIFKYAEKYGWDKYMFKLHEELKILIDSMKNKKLVLDCGGGTISSEFYASKLNADLLKKNSKIILFLPDEDEERGIQVLFERERERGLWKNLSDEKLLEKVRKDYFERVPGMKEYAHEIIITKKETTEELTHRVERLIKK